MSVVDMTGQVFERLTVLERAGSRRGGALWRCACTCGATTLVVGCNLRSGRVRSCGCLSREINAARMFKHGHATRSIKRTPTYTVWEGMRQRCLNPSNPRWQDYGGRGITISDRWADFENFLEDMGERPAMHLTLDRIDVNGNYEPGNCRWADMTTQIHNRRPFRRPNSRRWRLCDCGHRAFLHSYGWQCNGCGTIRALEGTSDE